MFPCTAMLLFNEVQQLKYHAIPLLTKIKISPPKRHDTQRIPLGWYRLSVADTLPCPVGTEPQRDVWGKGDFTNLRWGGRNPRCWRGWLKTPCSAETALLGMSVIMVWIFESMESCVAIACLHDALHVITFLASRLSNQKKCCCCSPRSRPFLLLLSLIEWFTACIVRPLAWQIVKDRAWPKVPSWPKPHSEDEGNGAVSHYLSCSQAKPTCKIISRINIA